MHCRSCVKLFFHENGNLFADLISDAHDLAVTQILHRLRQDAICLKLSVAKLTVIAGNAVIPLGMKRGIVLVQQSDPLPHAWSRPAIHSWSAFRQSWDQRLEINTELGLTHPLVPFREQITAEPLVYPLFVSHRLWVYDQMIFLELEYRRRRTSELFNRLTCVLGYQEEAPLIEPIQPLQRPIHDLWQFRAEPIFDRIVLTTEKRDEQSDRYKSRGNRSRRVWEPGNLIGQDHHPRPQHAIPI